MVENLINGKLYAGKHSSNDLDDRYMGSGKLILAAVKKYGVENFRRYVLAYFESEKEALKFESQIVDEEFVKDENTYNLTLGGIGSFYVCNVDLPQRHVRLSEQAKRGHREGRLMAPDWTGRAHRSETKEKIRAIMKIAQAGTRNSQSGKTWISNHVLRCSKRVTQIELQVCLEQGWVLGRRMKW